MQIKTTMRYHLSPIRMAIINKTGSVGEDVERRELSTLLVGVQTGAATMENSMEIPQKIKDRTTIWSSNSTAGYLSKEPENTNA